MRALVLQQPWDFYGVYAVYSQLLLLQVSISTVHLSATELFLYPIWEFQWIKSTEFCKVNRKTDKTAARFCFVPITLVTPFVFALQCHLSPLSHCKLKPPKKRDTKIHAVLGVDISTVSLICLIEDCNIPHAISNLVSKLSRLLHILNKTRNVPVRTKTHFQESKYYKWFHHI